MPATYEPIATVVLTSSASGTLHTFSSIPSTYTDLVLVAALDVSSNPDYGISIRFNSDSGSNYGFTYITGNGNGASSNARITNNQFYLCYAVGVGTIAPSVFIVNIHNYASSNMNKPVSVKSATVASGLYSGVEINNGVWASTNPITSIDFISPVSVIASGSTLTLYGIKAA